jgi:hypothetical protein
LSWADICDAEHEQVAAERDMMRRVELIASALASSKVRNTIVVPRNLDVYPRLSQMISALAEKLRVNVIPGASDMSLVAPVAAAFFADDDAEVSRFIAEQKVTKAGKALLSACATIEGVFNAMLRPTTVAEMKAVTSPYYHGRYLVCAHLVMYLEERIQDAVIGKSRAVLKYHDGGYATVKKALRSAFPNADAQVTELMSVIMGLLRSLDTTLTAPTNQEKHNTREAWRASMAPLLRATPGAIMGRLGRTMKVNTVQKQKNARGKEVSVDVESVRLISPSIPSNKSLMIGGELEIAEAIQRAIVPQELLKELVEPCNSLAKSREVADVVIQRLYAIGDKVKHSMKNRKQIIRAAALRRMQGGAQAGPKQKQGQAGQKIPQDIWLEESQKLLASYEQLEGDGKEVPGDIGAILEREFGPDDGSRTAQFPPAAMKQQWINQLHFDY